MRRVRNHLSQRSYLSLYYIVSLSSLLARSPTIHRGLECASVFELVSVCLIVCLSANIIISLLILLWHPTVSSIMNSKEIRCDESQIVVPRMNPDIQYSRVQYSRVQYGTVQYSIVQYIKVQYSTVQYSIVPRNTS